MTDKELLQAAAKAAALQIEDGQHGLSVWVDAPLGIGGWWKDWNPLTNSGDALDLAVKLGLSVFHRHTYANPQPVAVACGSNGDDADASETPYEGDPCAATRRAIVRAAASLSDDRWLTDDQELGAEHFGAEGK